MVTRKLQERTNHVALVIDNSDSMSEQPVEKVFDLHLNNLKRKSVDFNQETRISIYLFDYQVACLVSDMDVMRFDTLKGLWTPHGMTALRDGVGDAITDHLEIPRKYGDHAHVLYLFTDGEENASKRYSVPKLQSMIKGLDDAWTLAGLVPNQTGKRYLEDLGFPKDSIDIWNTNEVGGFEKMGNRFAASVDNFMQVRSQGGKSVKNGLFTVDTSTLNKTVVKTQLKELPTTEFTLYNVYEDSRMDDLINKWGKSAGRRYVKGCAYYQLTKKEKIQDYKVLLLQDVKTGKVYEGDKLRTYLGLPEATVEVNPGMHKEYRIFCQSTADNRKAIKGTFALHRF